MIQLGPDPRKWPEPFKTRYAERLSRVKSQPLTQYQSDPQGYSHDVLGVRLTPDQSLMLQSIVENRRTLVKASHAIGKTFTAAVAESWWYDCWSKHIGYITAPTWPQAFGLTFKQLKQLRRSKELPGVILEKEIRDPDRNAEGYHYIRALNAETGEGFQGEHSAPILIVIEEGVGVPKYIWDAVGGLMTHPDCRVFAIGNPTDEATEFGLASESILYNVLSISALDHPNIAAELACQSPPFPDAVRLQWLYEMLEKECERVEKPIEDSFEFHALPEVKAALEGRTPSGETWHYQPTAYFQGRVLGEFPTQADQQVIPKSWLKSQSVLTPVGPYEIGCDVARHGDDRTTIIVKRGACALTAKEIRKMDTVEVTAAIKDTALEFGGTEFEAKHIAIRVDVTGGLGAGPYDQLKHAGYNAEPVNSSEKASNTEQFKNRRSELWFDTRNRARDKRLDLSRLRKDVRERLERELSAPKYKIVSGQKVVEDKAQMKQRLGYSPDLADALNLAFAPESKRVRVFNF